MPLSSTEITALETDLAAIRAAIRTGARTVQFSDRSTTFQSLAELRQTERELIARLRERPKQTYLVGAKGFGP